MGISYSVDVDDDKSAKAIGRDLSVSHKDSVEIAKHIKGMDLNEAIETLEGVIEEEEAVPMKTHNAGVGHRKDLDGWDAGRFPQKAAKKVLDVIRNAEANAEYQEFDTDEMYVYHIAAHKTGESRGMKPRAYGRWSDWNSPIVDIEVVLLEKEGGDE